MGAVKTETIQYTQGGVTLKGYLAYDDAAGPKRPGVLVVPEWWGLNDYAKGQAEQLAKLGYVAFAADMYGDGKTTEDMKVAPTLAGPIMEDRGLMRARVNAAFDQLKNRPGVTLQHPAYRRESAVDVVLGSAHGHRRAVGLPVTAHSEPLGAKIQSGPGGERDVDCHHRVGIDGQLGASGEGEQVVDRHHVLGIGARRRPGNDMRACSRP